jgi:hypothetical protein
MNKVVHRMITKLFAIDRVKNPKHEIRISKQSQMTKIRMFKTNQKFGKFEF